MSCGLRHGKDKRLCSREPDRAFPVSEGRDLSGVGQGESGGRGTKTEPGVPDAESLRGARTVQTWSQPPERKPMLVVAQ